jgi:hypothetical protein
MRYLINFLADCADLIFYGLSANGTIALSRELGLINAGVYCTQAFKTFLKFWRKSIVSLNLGKEEGVASSNFGLGRGE